MSLLMEGTAQAAEVSWVVGARAVHGTDWGEIRTMAPGDYNNYLIVCDGEDDGHYVWADYHVIHRRGGFSGAYVSLYDRDGANNNSCGTSGDYQDTEFFARAIRVCEYNGGCSGWSYIAGTRAVHGTDWGEIRSVGSYNDYIIVCDGEDDGHYVWAQYLLESWSSGSQQYVSLYDRDGANNNSCGIADYEGYFARAIRVCEYNGGCSDWSYGDLALTQTRATKVATS